MRQSVDWRGAVVIKLLGVLLAFTLVVQSRAVVSGLGLSPAEQAAAKPNFSGEWKMNVEESNFGPLPPPTVFNRSIAHVEPALTIVEEQQSAMGDQKTTRKYVTNGSEISFDVQGMVVSSSATWKDSAIICESRVDAAGLSFTDRMTLSPDGKTLTSAVHITSAQGDADITVVFEKQ
jgi:hypothetical protein